MRMEDAGLLGMGVGTTMVTGEAFCLPCVHTHVGLDQRR